MNKVLSIIKKSTHGSCILEEVHKRSEKLSSIKSYDYFQHYYDEFWGVCEKMVGYDRCLLDLNVITWEDYQDFLDLIYRYTDLVHSIVSSHLLY